MLAEGKVYQEAGREEQGAAFFVSTGWADQKVNQFGSYIGAGVVYTGVFPGRGEDQLGLAVASAINTEEFRWLSSAEGMEADWAETAIELTYQFGLGNGVVLHPDVQYIVNPGTDRQLGNAFVVGLGTSLAF